MKIKRSFISILLCLALLLTCFATMNAMQVGAADSTKKATSSNDYGLMSTVQSSTVLQAWDWKYTNVEANLTKIAEQGFTTIQVSPASVLNGTSAGSTFNDAWKVYQPGALKMNAGTGMPDNNVLGTKAQFTSMCNAAHDLGIKIIVDTVVNHVGGDKFTESDTNPLNHLTADGYYIKNYQSELYNRSCFHDYYILSDWDDDWQLTQYAVLNLPDLNTSNSTVQAAAYNYLEELVAAGADGFRFDAAKHIETPSDRSAIKSSFWTNTLTKVQNAHSGKEIYAYGEVLGVGNNRQYSWYTSLMDVTDSGTSDSIRNAIINKTTSGATPWLPSGAGNPDQIVLWTESHDNFEGGSYSTPESQIGKIWALEAGRATTTCMYFGRPGNDSSYRNLSLGTASQTGWANATTKAVNQFHNHFNGQSEYTATQGNIAYIERGSTGAVLVNATDGYGSMSVTNHNLSNGSYKDAITGNTFTVANGTISGSIGSTGVAVIYKDGETPVVSEADIEVKSGYNTVVFTNNKGWGAPNVYYWGGTGAATWPGDAMSYCGTNEYGQSQYVGYVPTTCSSIIINDGSNQSADYTTLTGHTGLYLTDTTDSNGRYKLGTFSISDMLPASSATNPTEATQPSSSESSGTSNNLYLSVGSPYTNDSPKWYIWTWGTGSSRAVQGTYDSTSQCYKFTDYDSNVIFLRVNPSKTFDGSDWTDSGNDPVIWNKTGDKTVPSGKNKFTITSWFDGTWGTYTEPTQPTTYDYTIKYKYDLDGQTQTLTRTLTGSTLTSASEIAAEKDPSSSISDMAYTYAIGSCTKSGTTVTANMTKTANKYEVSLNGTKVGDYSYLDTATVNYGSQTNFFIDGAFVKSGKSLTVYVTGDMEITTGSSSTRTDTASINLTGTHISDTKVSYEFLSTANINKFARMGVVFAKGEKTTAQLTSAVNTVTSGTQVSNGIAVHNSSVDQPNSSGLYQFRYGPYLTISNVPANGATLYFYTFAVTTGGTVILSDAKPVSVTNTLA